RRPYRLVFRDRDRGHGPGGAVIRGANRPQPGGDLAVRRRVELGEDIDQYIGRNDDDDVAEGLIVRTRIVDAAGRLPGVAAVCGEGEVARAALRLRTLAVPDGIYIVRISRVGGDRALVVEESGAVGDEAHRRGPGVAAVDGARNQLGVRGTRCQRAA